MTSSAKPLTVTVIVIMILLALSIPKQELTNETAQELISAVNAISVPAPQGEKEVWTPTPDGSYVRDNGGAFLEVGPYITPDGECWADITLQRQRTYDWSVPCVFLLSSNINGFVEAVLKRAGIEIKDEVIRKFTDPIRPTQELIYRLLRNTNWLP